MYCCCRGISSTMTYFYIYYFKMMCFISDVIAVTCNLPSVSLLRCFFPLQSVLAILLYIVHDDLVWHFSSWGGQETNSWVILSLVISEDKCHNTDQPSCVLNMQLFAFCLHFSLGLKWLKWQVQQVKCWECVGREKDSILKDINNFCNVVSSEE